MCKKQTSVSHSSTESEIISLDIGLRLDGLLALELWDLIVSVFGSVSQRFGEPFEGPIIPFVSLVEYHPTTAKDQSRIHQFGKKVLPGLFLGYALYAGRFLNDDMMVADIEELETMDASEIYSKKTQCERGDISQRKRRIYFSNRRWTNQTPWRRSGPENIHLGTASTNSRRE